MSAPDRRAMVKRPEKDPSVRRQFSLLNLARSGVYRPKPVTAANDLAFMRRIDELHLELRFYGSRRMMFELTRKVVGSTGSPEAGAASDAPDARSLEDQEEKRDRYEQAVSAL